MSIVSFTEAALEGGVVSESEPVCDDRDRQEESAVSQDEYSERIAELEEALTLAQGREAELLEDNNRLLREIEVLKEAGPVARDEVEIASMANLLRGHALTAFEALEHRVHSAADVSEKAVLEVGECVTSIVDDARKQLVETQRVQDEVGQGSAFSQAIDAHTHAVRSFVATVTKQLNEQRQSAKLALRSTEQVAKAGSQIDEIAQESRILNLNARIEAAHLGDAGKAFAVIAGEMGKLSGSIASANNMIGDLTETLLRELPRFLEQVEQILDLQHKFGEELAHGLAELGEAEAHLRLTVGESVELGQERVDNILRTSQEALSALSFQDPMKQHLDQIPVQGALLLNTVPEMLKTIDPNAEGHVYRPFVDDYGGKSLLTPEEPVVEQEEDGEDAAEAGELLLF